MTLLGDSYCCGKSIIGGFEYGIPSPDLEHMYFEYTAQQYKEQIEKIINNKIINLSIGDGYKIYCNPDPYKKKKASHLFSATVVDRQKLPEEGLILAGFTKIAEWLNANSGKEIRLYIKEVKLFPEEPKVEEKKN